MDDDSGDGGGLLLWVGLGMALIVGAGAFMYLRLGPTRPPSQAIATAPVLVPSSMPPPQAPRTTVADGDLAWAKGASVTLAVTKKELVTAPNGVQRWTFEIELKNGGAESVDAQIPSDLTTYLETRNEAGVVAHGTSTPDPATSPVTLKPGESVKATVGMKFRIALKGEGRLVHVGELKDGTRACVATEWFPLEEGE